MFDIGFAELLLLAVIALLVLGPERLPGAVRTGSLWLGRLKRSFNEIKTEIEREIDADEIKRELHNQTILDQLGEEKGEVEENLQAVRDTLKDLEFDINNSNGSGHQDYEPLPRDSETKAPQTSDTEGKPREADSESGDPQSNDQAANKSS